MAVRRLLVQVLGTTRQLPAGDTIASDFVSEGVNLFFTTARVLATVLTGLSTVGPQAAVVSSDTVLVAIGKLQAQINSVLSTVLTGLSVSTANNVPIAATDTILTAFGKTQSQINALGTMAYQTAAAAPYVNLMSDSGRFSGKMNPLALGLSATFSASTWFAAFNGSSQADGGMFAHDNSTNGGAGSAINADVQALLAAMKRTGASARYGVEFRIATFTAGNGTDVQYQGTDGVTRSLASINNVRAVFGSSGFATFAGWVRAKTGSISIAAQFYLNGVLTNNAPITPAMGWVHVRKVGGSALGYDNAFPYLLSTAGGTFQLACPTFFSGQVDTGTHTSPIPTVNELSA